MELSEELLLQIFSFVSPFTPRLILSLSIVNKDWNRILHDEQLWQLYHTKYLSPEHLLQSTWRASFYSHMRQLSSSVSLADRLVYLCEFGLSTYLHSHLTPKEDEFLFLSINQSFYSRIYSSLFLPLTSLAARQGHISVLQFLCRTYFPQLRKEIFVESISRGHASIVQYLLEEHGFEACTQLHSQKIYFFGCFTYPLLIRATESASVDVMKLLVQHGVLIHFPEDQLYKLVEASLRTNQEVIAYLTKIFSHLGRTVRQRMVHAGIKSFANRVGTEATEKVRVWLSWVEKESVPGKEERKRCRFHQRGHCKKGDKCRYVHENVREETPDVSRVVANEKQENKDMEWDEDDDLRSGWTDLGTKLDPSTSLKSSTSIPTPQSTIPFIQSDSTGTLTPHLLPDSNVAVPLPLSTSSPQSQTPPSFVTQPPPDFICLACGKTPISAKRCGRCRQAIYCSQECQKRDWGKHKLDCFSAAEAPRSAQTTPITTPTTSTPSIFRFGSKNDSSFSHLSAPTKKETKEMSPPDTHVPECPICTIKLLGMTEIEMNRHIDNCLSQSFLAEEQQTQQSLDERLIQTLSHQDTLFSYQSPSSSREKLKCSDGNPFRVDCPYPHCTINRTEARHFAYHVAKDHSAAASHKYACPVCTLTNGYSYSVKDTTNLLDHLQNTHADMLVASTQIFGAISTPTPQSTPHVSTYGPPPKTDPYGNRVIPPPSSSNSSNSNPRGHCNECQVVDGHLTTCSMFRKPGVTAQLPRQEEPAILGNLWAEEEPDDGDMGDLFGDDSPPRVPDTTTTTTTSSSRFAEETLKTKIPGECMICFEEFNVGAIVARLQCFCVFHRDCITLWFKKSDGHCPLHVDG